MSQMKPYCFKCGAELDPEAIYCPECGRLQRSMVVRAVEPGAPSPPPVPRQGTPHDQPYQFYPGREAPPDPQQGDPNADQSYHYPDAARQHPDQPDPYAQQYSDQGWNGGETAEPPHDHGGWDTPTADPAANQEQSGPAGDNVYAHEDYQDLGNGTDQSYGGASWADYQQPAETGYQPADDAGYHQPADTGYHQPADTGYQQSADTGYHQPADSGSGHYDTSSYPQQEHGGYGEPEQPADYGQTGYGHAGESQSGQPGQEADPWRREPAAEAPEPWQSKPDPEPPAYPPTPYSPRDSAYGPVAHAAGAAPSYSVPPVPPAPPPTAPQEPSYEPPAPVYSSTAPAPAAGGYSRTPTYPPPSGPRYGSTPGSGRYGQPPGSNPYAMTTYDAGEYGASKPAGASPLRLVALAAAVLLGLFLVGFGIGHLLGVGSSSGNPQAAANSPTHQPTTAPTTQPSSTPISTPTPAPTPSAGQGVTGTAKFQRVSSSIPGTCSTSQGCPVQIVARNTGGSGSGTVNLTLTDDGGNQIATFAGPVPVTDAGATVTVNGYATGDNLGTYLRSGGIVHITSVTFTSGG